MTKDELRSTGEAKEKWLPIPGWESRYLVSDRGRVYSLISGMFRKLYINGNGYKGVVLVKKGVSSRTGVHRLVAAAFLGKSELCVNHKNNIKTDNRIENLEYLTLSENTRYSRVHHGLSFAGERNPNLRFNEKTVRNIHELSKHKGFREIARSLKTSHTYVRKVVRGHLWPHIFKELATERNY